MTTVIVSYPNGAQEEVVLDAVPRVGDSIRLPNGKPGTTLIVLHVLWLTPSERDPSPSVVIEVRARDEE